MCANKPSEWPGIPCESDAWPFVPHYIEFEARRAVGQVVRTMTSYQSLAPDDDQARRWHPTLLYLTAAKALSETLPEVIGELVAEARASGVTWADIGFHLGVGHTAAQKRYGAGLEPRRMASLEDRASVVRHAQEGYLDIPFDGQDEVAEELEGATPADRMRYAYSLIRQAYLTLNELEVEVYRKNPSNQVITEKIFIAKNKVSRLMLTLLTDSAVWDAVADWSKPAPDPHAANYYAPATYLYYVLYQVELITIHLIDAFADKDNELLTQFSKIKEVVDSLMLVLLRDDVKSALSSAEWSADV